MKRTADNVARYEQILLLYRVTVHTRRVLGNDGPKRNVGPKLEALLDTVRPAQGKLQYAYIGTQDRYPAVPLWLSDREVSRNSKSSDLKQRADVVVVSHPMCGKSESRGSSTRS